jgi:predicted secreted hydrolase
MRSRLACFLAALLALPLAAQYRSALPGYHFEFPRDHFSHPDFQTEWWYYTGNLKSSGGHRFGFELTFFRQAVNRNPAKSTSWDVRDLYLAHLALSDLDGQRFYHDERVNRSGPGIAGVSENGVRIWNGNWQIQWTGDDQRLQAVDDSFELHFTLHSAKTPVIHGQDGVSQKAARPGRASHYVSLTRLVTKGSIELNGKEFDVTGFTWIDHEFFTNQLEADQAGWDWLSIQLEDNTEFMLFRIRRKDGSIDPYSAGTFVDAQGRTIHLKASDFMLQPSGRTWTSPDTHAAYPVQWKIVMPKFGIEMEVTTPLMSQELAGKSKLAPNYWEGAIILTGHRGNQALHGVGYLEMTGYDRPFEFIPKDSPAGR